MEKITAKQIKEFYEALPVGEDAPAKIKKILERVAETLKDATSDRLSNSPLILEVTTLVVAIRKIVVESDPSENIEPIYKKVKGIAQFLETKVKAYEFDIDFFTNAYELGSQIEKLSKFICSITPVILTFHGHSFFN